MRDDHFDILARLLAAEEHPHLKDKPEFQEAYRALEDSASLQAELAECRAFFQQHPALVRVEAMPGDTRRRIEAALRRELGTEPSAAPPELSPWTMRTQFAWAAVLMLLLAGMAVISSSIIERNEQERQRLVRKSMAPRDAFRSFVIDTVDHRLPLQERNPDSAHLVNWLYEQGAETFHLPAGLAERETLGCAYLDGPNGKVALICFGLDGRVVHLFIAPSRQLAHQEPHPPERLMLNEREAVQWNDDRNAYLLISHAPGEPLPTFPLDAAPTGASDPESPRPGEISRL